VKVWKYREHILHIAVKWLQLDTCVAMVSCISAQSRSNKILLSEQSLKGWGYVTDWKYIGTPRVLHFESYSRDNGRIIENFLLWDGELPVTIDCPPVGHMWHMELFIVIWKKIYRQNMVHYIGSRASIVGEGTSLWAGQYSVWIPTEARTFSFSKTPRAAVGSIEPLVSKMGTGVLPQR
jgi:hypothetical protein